MGLPKAKVMALKAPDGDTEDDDDRFRGEGDREPGSDDDLARLVTIDECYIRCDRDGTGVLGWRKVFIGASGDDVLLDEEADDHPYETWTPIPLPHKLVGMSVYDLVRDLQMQGTALAREMMNALYLSNRPQREVKNKGVNIEDLLNPEVGGIVRVDEIGSVREIPSGGEGVIQQSMAMMEQIASMREQRTGSTRYNQGMDANSLNKTATGISIIQNASTQRQELVARHLAEGIKGIFRKMLGLTIRHMDKAQVIRLRGKWVEMNPADWKAGYDMSVSVGLGTGNRDQQVGQLHELLGLDEKIIQLQQGIDGPLLTAENIYEKLKRLVEAMGLKGIENYYTDPSAEDDPNSPQAGGEEADPAQQAQDAQMQADVQRFQAETKRDMDKAELEARTKIEIARIGAVKDLIIHGIPQPEALLDVALAAEQGEDGQEMAPEMPEEQPEPQMAGMMPDMPMEAPQGPEMGEMGPIPDASMDTGMMPPEFEQ